MPKPCPCCARMEDTEEMAKAILTYINSWEEWAADAANPPLVPKEVRLARAVQRWTKEEK